jgi:cyclohexa-1,5-dienecarbonyl-CoA hydratase
MAAIHLEFRQRAAFLTLDRPPLNILDIPTLRELDGALQQVVARQDLAVLVLRGAAHVFSAGAAVEDHVPERVAAMLDALHGAIRTLRSLPTISCAAVAGHCLGGGMELAISCDFVVASDDARFGQPEIALGCFPPVAAALYPRLLGPGRALDLLTTGRTLSAAELEPLGLLTRRAATGELDQAVETLVAALTRQSTAVLRLIKETVRTTSEQPFSVALAQTERIYLEQLCRTADMEEGIAAFLAKRPPRWQHR